MEEESEKDGRDKRSSETHKKSEEKEVKIHYFFVFDSILRMVACRKLDHNAEYFRIIFRKSKIFDNYSTLKFYLIHKKSTVGQHIENVWIVLSVDSGHRVEFVT